MIRLYLSILKKNRLQEGFKFDKLNKAGCEAALEV